MAAPARGAVGGAVDVVFLGLLRVEHLRVGVEAWQDGLAEVAELVEQALLLGPRDGDDGAVARGELALGLRILYELEGLQVLRATELVVAVAIAVVHDDPRLAVDGLAHADALHRLLGLLHVAVEHLPLVRQVLGHGLIDAASGLLLVEEVIHLVCIVVDDVAVDGGIAGIEEPAGLALEVGEVLVGILVVDLVERAGFAGAQGVEHHILFGLVVVDGLRGPDADHVLPGLGVAGGEVYCGVLPVDEISRLEQHHAAVARPAEAGAHIGGDHIEGLAVLAAQDVGIADALGQGDSVAGDNGGTVVERGVVVAVVADGVADLLVLGGVAVEIGEEIGHHLVGVLRLLGYRLFLACNGSVGYTCQ